MTDDQLAALNARLDRIEAAQAETNGRIDTWREALESVNGAMRAAVTCLEGLPQRLGEAAGNELAKQVTRLVHPLVRILQQKRR